MVGTILIGLLCMLIWYYFVTPLSYWKKLGVKQTKPWIFFGDSWRTVFRTTSIAEFVAKLYNMYPDKRYFGFYQFSNPTLLVRDIELIKTIAVRDFDHFTDHKFFIDPEADPFWGGNLFALEGQKWREMRATLSGIFTSSKIKNMFVLMEETANNFVDYILNKNEEILEADFKNLFSRYTNDVIATTALGIKVDSLNEPNNVFYQMGKDLTNFEGATTNLKIMLYLTAPKLMKILKIGVFSRKLTTFFAKIINETIQAREKNKIVRPDLINLLIDARKGMKVEENESNEHAKKPVNIGNFKQYRNITNEDIVSQAFLFFFGGFDTISTTTCFACHELAFNKDVQDKMRAEIIKTNEENDGKLTYDVLMQMKYLDMVVSETLRKWPLAIYLDRVCTKPYTIEPVNSEEKRLELKVGDVLWIPVWGIHRNPAFYKNPEKFEPERFSDRNQHNITSSTYLPFGIGPRNCIGNRFALVEVKVLLYNLLLNFEILPTSKTKETIELSKKSFIPIAYSFWLGLKPIKN